MYNFILGAIQGTDYLPESVVRGPYYIAHDF